MLNDRRMRIDIKQLQLILFAGKHQDRLSLLCNE